MNGNYEPLNCRWISQKEQMNNVRYNRILKFKDIEHTVSEWADVLGISASCILQRIDRYNYTIEDALTKPVKTKKSKN